MAAESFSLQKRKVLRISLAGYLRPLLGCESCIVNFKQGFEPQPFRSRMNTPGSALAKTLRQHVCALLVFAAVGSGQVPSKDSSKPVPSPALQQAIELAGKKRWVEAAREVEVYRREQPNSADGAVIQAEIMMHLGLLKDAVDVLDQILAVQPHSSSALNAAAHVAESLKETDSAERYFTQVTKYHPRQISSWIGLGDFYLRWGRKEAKNAFARALALNPDDARALSGLAAATSVLGDDAAAARDFERASVLNRKAAHPDAMVNLRFADFLQDHEKNAESVAQYERALQLDPDSVDAHMGRARSLTRLKQWEPAERDLLICVKDEGKKIQALTLLAKASQAQGRTEEAQRYAAQAERLSSEAIAQKAANNRIASLLQDAHASMVKKQFAQAAASYQHLLDDHPDVSQAWFELGRCHIETGQIDEAESDLRQFLAQEDRSASGHVLLGRILLRQKQASSARNEFLRAQQIDPLLADARLGIGASYIVENNFQEAIAALRKLDALPAPNPEARLMLSEALYKNHQPEEALREIDRLLRQDPANEAARQMRISLLQNRTPH